MKKDDWEYVKVKTAKTGEIKKHIYKNGQKIKVETIKSLGNVKFFK